MNIKKKKSLTNVVRSFSIDEGVFNALQHYSKMEEASQSEVAEEILRDFFNKLPELKKFMESRHKNNQEV
jgi:hypothetical protein